MWCRLVIAKNEGAINSSYNDSIAYYLYDLKSKRAVAYRCNGPLGLVDNCDMREDFDYERFIKMAKEQNKKKHCFFQLLKEQNIEVYDEFFEKMFENYKRYKTEKRRFETNARNLFDIE